MAMKIKRGDRGTVTAGRDKGKKGDVIKVFPTEDRVLVSGVNVVKRHQRQTQTQQGGIVSKEAPIDVSTIAHIDPKSGGPTRIGFKVLGEAADGESAVALARRLRPRVVLLDIQLPGMDGFAVAERLAAEPAAPPGRRQGAAAVPLVGRRLEGGEARLRGRAQGGVKGGVGRNEEAREVLVHGLPPLGAILRRVTRHGPSRPGRAAGNGWAGPCAPGRAGA